MPKVLEIYLEISRYPILARKIRDTLDAPGAAP